MIQAVSGMHTTGVANRNKHHHRSASKLQSGRSNATMMHDAVSLEALHGHPLHIATMTLPPSIKNEGQVSNRCPPFPLPPTTERQTVVQMFSVLISATKPSRQVQTIMERSCSPAFAISKWSNPPTRQNHREKKEGGQLTNPQPTSRVLDMVKMAEMNLPARHGRLMSFPSNASHSVASQIQSANFVKVS